MKVDRRYPAPRTTDELCEFSKDSRLKHYRCFTDSFPQVKWLWEPLRDATRTVKPRHQSKAMRGNWTLLYLYFVGNGNKYVNVEPFYGSIENDLHIWKAFGFARVPDYWTVWDHFGRLEEFREAFEQAAYKLSRLLAERIAGYGGYVHTDSSPGPTPARPEHICRHEKYVNCPTANGADHGDHDHEPDGRRRRSRRRGLPTRISAEQASERKQEAIEDDDTSLDEHPAGVDPRVRDLLAGGIRYGFITDDGKYLVYRTKNGHLMRTRDIWAGVRVYDGKGRNEQWHGDYSTKTVDHLLHSVIAVTTGSCSVNESIIAPAHNKKLREALGKTELAHVYDAGYATEKVAVDHAKHGVAVVHPGRNEKARKTDTLLGNRFGERPCPGCGGPTKVTDVNFEPYPHWVIQCLFPSLAACDGEHKKALSDDWLRFGLLPRTHPTFQTLQRTHSTYEGAHRQWANCFGVAGKHYDDIPHRVSEGVRALRPAAALLIQNFWLCIRLNLLPEVTGDYTRVNLVTWTQDDITADAMMTLRVERMKAELFIPYGPAAEAVGWGDALPASQRKKTDGQAKGGDERPDAQAGD